MPTNYYHTYYTYEAFFLGKSEGSTEETTCPVEARKKAYNLQCQVSKKFDVDVEHIELRLTEISRKVWPQN